MKLLFILGLFPLSLLAEVICPSESYKVDHRSSVSGNRTIVCMKSYEGSRVKHGPEVITNESGNVIEQNQYENGKKVKRKSAVRQQQRKPVARQQKGKAMKPVGLPGVSEHHDKFLKKVSKGTPIGKGGGIESVKTLFTSLMRAVLPMWKNKKNNGRSFKVSNCGGNMRGWFALYTMQKPFTESIKFRGNCDIEGSFKPKVNSSFPMNLKLRNIDPFNSAKMNIQLKIKNGSSGIVFYFQCLKGVLQGPGEEIGFTGEYSVVINPMRKNLVERDLGGKIHVTEINGEPKDIKQDLPPGTAH